jgi:hypothetical protein
VCVEYLTKWVEAFALPDQTADTIAKVLVEQVICRFGPSKEILSDRGKNFLSVVMQEVTKIFNMRKISTAPYNPKCDGAAEKFNSTLLKMLSSYTASNQDDWDLHLPYCLYAYRAVEQSTTGFSPFFLMFGREPGLPSDYLFEAPTLEYVDAPTYAHHLSTYLGKAWKWARSNILGRQQEYQERYDRTAFPHTFKTNDQVLIYTPQPQKGKSPKLQRLWKGPFVVVAHTPQNLLVHPTNKPKKEPFWVSCNRCKSAPALFRWRNLQLEPTADKAVPLAEEDAEIIISNQEEIEVDIPETLEAEVPETMEDGEIMVQQEDADDEQQETETAAAEKPETPPGNYFRLRNRTIPKVLTIMLILMSVFSATEVSGIPQVIKDTTYGLEEREYELYCDAFELAAGDSILWIYQDGPYVEKILDLKPGKLPTLILPHFMANNQGNYSCIHLLRTDMEKRIPPRPERTSKPATILLELPRNECTCEQLELVQYGMFRYSCQLSEGRTEAPTWFFNDTLLMGETIQSYHTKRHEKVTLIRTVKPVVGQIHFRSTPYSIPWDTSGPVASDYTAPITSSGDTMNSVPRRRSTKYRYEEEDVTLMDTTLLIQVTSPDPFWIQMRVPGCGVHMKTIPRYHLFLKPPPSTNAEAANETMEPTQEGTSMSAQPHSIGNRIRLQWNMGWLSALLGALILWQ